MMLLWGSITGFMVGIFPCILLQRIFGKAAFIGITHPYLKGAVFGFFTWVLAGVVMYMDLLYDIIGFMKQESGGTLIALYTQAHFGFITSGIAVAYFAQTLDILKKKYGGGQK